jgi:hypothetical protein
MIDETKAGKHDRRDFLKGLLAAGAALGTSAGLGGAAAAPEEAPPRPRKRLGYRETDHVRTYYAKASL